MKILIVGDQHFRFELPYASAIADGRRSEWEAVKKVIHDTAKDCDEVVLLGDNFNSRHNHSSVIREFVEFLYGFGDKKIHILGGNHERYGDKTAIDFLQKIPNPNWNWNVYTVPTWTVVGGKEAMMIPFMTPALLGVSTKEEGIEKLVGMFHKEKVPLCFAHHAISGGHLNGILVDTLNEIVLPKKNMLESFGNTFAGHIHEKEKGEGLTMAGNIFTNEVGEHEKSIWIYNEADCPGGRLVYTQEIPLPVRPIHKIIWEEEADKVFTLPKNSIVKCYVTDRKNNIENIKRLLSSFDAFILIEQYPSERAKIHFEGGVMDLSVETLLKKYAEVKDLPYQDLMDGFNLIRT